MKTGTIDEVQVNLEVVLGETSVSVRELSAVGPGTIIQLGSMAGEPVELRASGRAIALGEVVVIDENFGVRVTEVLGEGGRP
ncbi:MAG: FliM/FliN family flagellar motor switch protein [Spirochaetota bacterium]